MELKCPYHNKGIHFDSRKTLWVHTDGTICEKLNALKLDREKVLRSLGETLNPSEAAISIIERSFLKESLEYILNAINNESINESEIIRVFLFLVSGKYPWAYDDLLIFSRDIFRKMKNKLDPIAQVLVDTIEQGIVGHIRLSTDNLRNDISINKSIIQNLIKEVVTSMKLELFLSDENIRRRGSYLGTRVELLNQIKDVLRKRKTRYRKRTSKNSELIRQLKNKLRNRYAQKIKESKERQREVETSELQKIKDEFNTKLALSFQKISLLFKKGFPSDVESKYIRKNVNTFTLRVNAKNLQEELINIFDRFTLYISPKDYDELYYEIHSGRDLIVEKFYRIDVSLPPMLLNLRDSNELNDKPRKFFGRLLVLKDNYFVNEFIEKLNTMIYKIRNFSDQIRKILNAIPFSIIKSYEDLLQILDDLNQADFIDFDYDNKTLVWLVYKSLIDLFRGVEWKFDLSSYLEYDIIALSDTIDKIISSLIKDSFQLENLVGYILDFIEKASKFNARDEAMTLISILITSILKFNPDKSITDKLAFVLELKKILLRLSIILVSSIFTEVIHQTYVKISNILFNNPNMLLRKELMPSEIEFDGEMAEKLSRYITGISLYYILLPQFKVIKNDVMGPKYDIQAIRKKVINSINKVLANGYDDTIKSMISNINDQFISIIRNIRTEKTRMEILSQIREALNIHSKTKKIPTLERSDKEVTDISRENPKKIEIRIDIEPPRSPKLVKYPPIALPTGQNRLTIYPNEELRVERPKKIYEFSRLAANIPVVIASPLVTTSPAWTDGQVIYLNKEFIDNLYQQNIPEKNIEMLVEGLVAHEKAHIIFSNFNLIRFINALHRYLRESENILLRDLLNIIEDGRIEFLYSLVYPSKAQFLKFISLCFNSPSGMITESKQGRSNPYSFVLQVILAFVKGLIGDLENLIVHLPPQSRQLIMDLFDAETLRILITAKQSKDYMDSLSASLYLFIKINEHIKKIYGTKKAFDFLESYAEKEVPPLLLALRESLDALVDKLFGHLPKIVREEITANLKSSKLIRSFYKKLQDYLQIYGAKNRPKGIYGGSGSVKMIYPEARDYLFYLETVKKYLKNIFELRKNFERLKLDYKEKSSRWGDIFEEKLVDAYIWSFTRDLPAPLAFQGFEKTIPKMDIILHLDLSGSMSGQPANLVMQSAIIFLEAIRPLLEHNMVQVSVIGFGTEYTIIKSPKEEIHFGRFYPYNLGGTMIFTTLDRGLRTISDEFLRDSRKVIFIFTDTMDSLDDLSTAGTICNQLLKMTKGKLNLFIISTNPQVLGNIRKYADKILTIDSVTELPEIMIKETLINMRKYGFHKLY
ncbi:MAG: vWA domain-containing protein [Candidatus Njordarchaeia archaeon]